MLGRFDLDTSTDLDTSGQIGAVVFSRITQQSLENVSVFLCLAFFFFSSVLVSKNTVCILFPLTWEHMASPSKGLRVH